VRPMRERKTQLFERLGKCAARLSRLSDKMQALLIDDPEGVRMKTSTNRDKKSTCCGDGDGRKIGAHPDRERGQPAKVPAAVPLDVENWTGSHCLQL
jgi:hypothetical protein